MNEKTDGERMYEQARADDPTRPAWADLTQSVRDEWERKSRVPRPVPIKDIIRRSTERN